MKKLLLLSLFAIATISHADSSLGLKKDMSYKQARQILIKNNWRPAGADSSQDAGLSAETFKRYPETDSCAGTGEGPCNMVFTSTNKRTLTVHTIGGLSGDARDTTVISWEISKK